MPSPDEFPYRTRILEPQHVQCVQAFGPQVRESLNWTEHRDHLLDRMLWKLEATVYQEKQIDDQTIAFTHYFEFPANPWQHLKERFAPEWFLKRWPVRYEDEKATSQGTIKRTSWAKWPDMTYQPRELGSPVVISERHPDAPLWYAQ